MSIYFKVLTTMDGISFPIPLEHPLLQGVFLNFSQSEPIPIDSYYFYSMVYYFLPINKEKIFELLRQILPYSIEIIENVVLDQIANILDQEFAKKGKKWHKIVKRIVEPLDEFLSYDSMIKMINDQYYSKQYEFHRDYIISEWKKGNEDIFFKYENMDIHVLGYLCDWECKTKNENLLSYVLDQIKPKLIFNQKPNDYDEYDISPIQKILQMKFTKVTQKLMDKLDPNKFDKYGSTLFCYICEYSDFDSIKYLVEKGANVNTKFRENYWIDDIITPVRAICGRKDLFESDSVEMIEYLVEKGFDFFKGSHLERLPIEMLFSNAKENVFKYVIEKFSLLEYSCYRGWRPIHFACYRTDVPGLLPYLIEKGADLNSKTILGKRAVDICYEKNNKEQLLLFNERNIYPDLLQK